MAELYDRKEFLIGLVWSDYYEYTCLDLWLGFWSIRLFKHLLQEQKVGEKV